MNKNLLKLNTFFKKNNYKVVHPYNPHYHWVLLLRIFFSLLACLIIFSFYLLYEIKNDVIFANQDNLPKKDVLITRNEKLKNDVNLYFKDKQEKMELLKKDDLKVSDPRIMK